MEKSFNPRQSFSVYPTTRGLLVMAAGVPLSLFISFSLPQLSGIGVFFIIAVAGLLLADALLAAPSNKVEAHLNAPSLLFVDDVIDCQFDLTFPDNQVPQEIDLSVETDERLDIDPPNISITRYADSPIFSLPLQLSTRRRGETIIPSVWARWKGPFGLVYKQVSWKDFLKLPVVPNIKYVKQEAIKFFSRDAVHGEKIQIDKGEGTEFESLREFVKGMDVRNIDWKHSAKHQTLLAKEFRTERNHNIVLAFDRGRLMCEPVNYIPKIDRSINAGLMISYVALKTGDKIGVYSFAAKPASFSSPMGGLGSFTAVQKQLSEIDYSIVETNFTLGLAQLSQVLKRRSLVVIFTDFVDTITAEIMVENVTRLKKKHAVIFVTFKETALLSVTERRPQSTDDVSRAVIAGTLLTEREKVLARLKRLGVHVLEVRPEHLTTQLLNTYIAMREREEI